MGHGGLLCVLAIYLVFWSDKLKASGDYTWKMMAQYRYLVVLMGFFAFYCGSIYNEFLSIPTNIFGSCYEDPEEGSIMVKTEGCTYPYG